MAMQYAIRERSRSDRTISITVEWLDNAIGFSHRGNLNFHLIDGETGGQTRTRVRAEIERIGDEFRKALATVSALDSEIDVVRNVP